MKTTLGGDRLGSGNKQDISLKNYSRSTHDLSYKWRSSMSVGTLVPFMSEVGLPGDSFDIDLGCDVMTLPTIGPMFGSAKVQLDVFTVPMRLFMQSLAMDKLNIGLSMGDIKLPRITIVGEAGYAWDYNNNMIEPSCLLSYLGIKGNGKMAQGTGYRSFNALPLLSYWSIYKQYYANKQEGRGFAIHTDDTTESTVMKIEDAKLYLNGTYYGSVLQPSDPNIPFSSTDVSVKIEFGANAVEPDPTSIAIIINSSQSNTLDSVFDTFEWDDENKILNCRDASQSSDTTFNVLLQSATAVNDADLPEENQPQLVEFSLDLIDDMRQELLSFDNDGTAYTFSRTTPKLPYTFALDYWNSDGEALASYLFSQEGLGIKTYQSDLFNNWIDTEWLDGANGVNEVTAVSTTGNEFTIDALNLAQKVYVMLNRIAISGGTYDDWLDAVYTHERAKGSNSPRYHGSLIKELAFQEVISNADTSENPLGTLAGRGRLTNKNKGGSMKIKIDEPSYVMGIVSITPRVDYSQGNKWDVNLQTMDDFHKPALDAIGYQDLITDQMNAWDTGENRTFYSAGKVPAWINYMTNVDMTFGNFAIESKEMFMTFNRNYKIGADGRIEDLTTYIDPVKFNNVFAEASLSAQNYWVQISVKNIARRKMSAKVIPNL